MNVALERFEIVKRVGLVADEENKNEGVKETNMKYKMLIKI